jgi:hypothetical protein
LTCRAHFRSSPFLGGRPLLAHFGPAAPSLLAFGGLPSAEQATAFRIGAITLVPALRYERPIAPLAQTRPRWET